MEFTADPTTPATTTADDDTSPVVLLVYMVHGASWSPSYDIRVAEESDFLSLTYFGRIQQHTGEDWDQCAVKLSTATPSVGGRPPSIGTKTVRYRRPTFYHHHNNNNFNQQQHQGRHRRKSMKMMSRGATAASGRPSSVASAAYGAPMPPQAQRMFAAGDSMVGGDPLFTNAAESIEVEVDSDGVEHEGGGGVGVATASVEAGATSAAFMIERLTTITGDNKQRKVTIALIPMKTVATFYAVPSLEPKAYYRARATNPSEFPLLASQEAHIFFGSEFIGRTSLDATNPGESFTMFLGVDAAVKIDAKPVKKTTSTTGIMSKYSKTTFSHVVQIKNTKRKDIQITLAMALPRSNSDEITVKVITPLKENLAKVTKADLADGGFPSFAGDKSVIVNGGNVVWSLQVNAGAKDEIVLEYEIERPVGKDVEIV